MSCNGCKALRTRCKEDCKLRQCLAYIKEPEQQSNAASYIHKQLGRGRVTQLIANAPSESRPELFVSLLYEACGREVNPVSGAMGLIMSNKWEVCEAAVSDVLRGNQVARVRGPHPMEGDLFPSSRKKRARVSEESPRTSEESARVSEESARRASEEPPSCTTVVLPVPKRVVPLKECGQDQGLNLNLSLSLGSYSEVM